ncbi:methyltransferase domain-containing protein [Pseudoxanthomonas winnipegensis]|uniref:Methyltransferase domain-containing protein n=1 Tax=Pseudoxanthomonas winnipegensis TaxID=2480810 RepID=A0A4Q8LVT3_9GAMM|nr:methyltransferase domain-containing protein [Pseudoxanthomonas winnipegensis]TAA36021.1 methyltransferase domain-containing protein [Pseudoxanthomonas winnipegensis]
MSRLNHQHVKSTYRFYAPFYNAVFGFSLEQGRRSMASRVASLAPETVLEIGVGTGLTLARYPSSCNVAGIDISLSMLEKAKEQAKLLIDRSIDLFEMDAEELRFEDNSFDVVTAPYVLSVTPNPLKAIDEMRRVCKAGGHIVILNHFNGSAAWSFLEKLVKPLAKYIGFRSDFDFERYVSAINWKIESVEDVNIFSLSKLVIIRND